MLPFLCLALLIPLTSSLLSPFTQNLQHHHTITPNGYDSGRDQLVRAALDGGKFGSRLWKADVQWVEGMLPRGSDGINHEIPIDGLVAVLTVQRELGLGLGRDGREGRGAEQSRDEEADNSSTLPSQAIGPSRPPSLARERAKSIGASSVGRTS